MEVRCVHWEGLLASTSCHSHSDRTNANRNWVGILCWLSASHCWEWHHGLICKPTSTSFPEPVKTAGAAEQHMKNLICKKIICPQICLSMLESGKTHLRITVLGKEDDISLSCQRAPWPISLVVVRQQFGCQVWWFTSQAGIARLSNREAKLYQAPAITKCCSPWRCQVEGFISVGSEVHFASWPQIPSHLPLPFPLHLSFLLFQRPLLYYFRNQVSLVCHSINTFSVIVL